MNAFNEHPTRVAQASLLPLPRLWEKNRFAKRPAAAKVQKGGIFLSRGDAPAPRPPLASLASRARPRAPRWPYDPARAPRSSPPRSPSPSWWSSLPIQLIAHSLNRSTMHLCASRTLSPIERLRSAQLFPSEKNALRASRPRPDSNPGRPTPPSRPKPRASAAAMI